MRIALIAPLVAPLREPHMGGAQTHLCDIAAGLTRRGHVVSVYAAAGSMVPGVQVIDTGVDSVVLLPTLVHPGQRPQAASDAAQAAFATVFQAVDRAGYDVVHNHAFDAPAIRAAATVAAPVVHTLHLPPDTSVAAAVRQAQTGERPPTVAAVSTSHAGSWSAAVRIDAVLRPGVDTSRVPWSPARGTGLLFAGRLSPEKGVVEAIEIARAAAMPIDVYGDPYDPVYTERVERFRGRPGVALHAAVDRSALWLRMRQARAVLCPSTWEEPFGMVAAEANATGTPVVGFRSGGLAEVIDAGTTGVLVATGDISGAAAAVEEIGGFSRQACRRHAVDDLDLELTLMAHEALYRRLVTASASV